MPLEKHRAILTICAFVLVLILVVSALSALWPRYEERFFELGLLGRDGKAEGYYPDENSTLQAGVPLLWHIYVHNHMGSPQNVSVRVKILNATMTPPDDRQNKPSPVPHLAEFPISLSVDETLLMPFSWSILEAESQNGSVGIYRLMINDQSYDVEISGNPFRFVFELWVYDPSSNQYRFLWEYRGESYSSSIYMWFSLASAL